MFFLIKLIPFISNEGLSEISNRLLLKVLFLLDDDTTHPQMVVFSTILNLVALHYFEDIFSRPLRLFILVFICIF